MKCALCGRNIVSTGSNYVIKDGTTIHKKCPTDKVKLSTEEKQDLLSLKNRISYWLEIKPRGYVAQTGLNFMKVNVQIKKLKDDGYTYKEQLYALDKIVEKQDGFYGYTAVVNSIAGVIAKKREFDKALIKSKETKQTNINFDLSKLLTEEDDW